MSAASCQMFSRGIKGVSIPVALGRSRRQSSC